MVNSQSADLSSVADAEPLVRLRVAEHKVEAGNVAIVTLEPFDDRPLPSWTAGAHIAVRAGDTGIVREYSLCGSPRDRGRWTIAVRLAEDSRGGSRYVHEQLAVGAEVLVNRLSNHFEFRPTARPCFIAGGIGITPILPMVEAANRYGADWNLIYIGRDREHMPFMDTLESYGDRVTIIESSVSGRPNAAQVVTDNAGSHIFSCGPEPLLDGLSAASTAISDVTLTVERFTPRTIELPEHEIPFEVIVNSTGERVPVQPDQSTLAALLAAGVRVPNSCGEGTCGSCETVVIDGIPDHRDSILSEQEQAEGEYMYVCVSRSRTPTLTLDL
ncbi:hypothetical protein ASF40_20645 [Microbacterium sp. Leaf288]|uniref:PDR/VanB family oxidoreductase n=1 Tax=Microbacterium sp. Leaf288 TaxID=1736323 RepID=UPI0006FACB59|nr:PDR/VanB family oxidoreductase [Microbacterium sp. Leaf288]KQP72995.1 hypothetical protein ASF40_20645 [Microbacterium sp. Leaf288]